MLISCVETSMDFDMPEESFEVSFRPDVSTDDSFSDYESESTRATVTTSNTIKTFGVYAYETSRNFSTATSTPAFMCNQKVERSNIYWVYDPVKLWPAKVGNTYVSRLSFFAYSPYTATNTGVSPALTTTTTTRGYPVLNFTVPNTIKAQIDFLVANPLLNKTMADRNPTTKNLDIKFRHALSCIKFTGKLNANLDSAKVTKITLTNFRNKAKIDYTTTSFNWTSHANRVSYELIEGVGLRNIAHTKKNEVLSIMESNQNLMVMPQSLANTYKLTINVDYYLPFSDGGPVSLSKTVNLNTLISGSLEIGKQYTINIEIGEKDNLTDLTLNCSIEDWNKVTVNVPTFD